MKCMFRTMLAAVLLALVTGPDGLTAQLPTPASPLDGVPEEARATRSAPPVASLVESILAGEDDPAVWARLEDALAETGPATGVPGEEATTGATLPSWADLVAGLRSLPSPSRWSPEGMALVAVLGLLGVAGAGAGVGGIRRRRASRATRFPNRIGIPAAGRRRRSRSSRATCRDAARLEARLRHRRAA